MAVGRPHSTKDAVTNKAQASDFFKYIISFTSCPLLLGPGYIPTLVQGFGDNKGFVVQAFDGSADPDPKKDRDLHFHDELFFKKVCPVLWPPVKIVLFTKEPYRKGLPIL